MTELSLCTLHPCGNQDEPVQKGAGKGKRGQA